MKVLMISGDKNALVQGTAVYERMQVLRDAVEQLEIVYWGRGNVWPSIPPGSFDVVTAQDPFWRGLYGLWLARRLHARLNVQVHADLSAQPLFKHVLSHIVLRHADSVRAVSERIKAKVESLGVQASIAVLPVYIDIERFKHIEHEPHDEKNILWMGRFEWEKDPLRALEIFARVRKELPDARLIMLGKGSLATKLHAHTAKLDFAAQVAFPGWQDPLPYLAKADVVLSTSPSEGYGASIVEALAAGVAVVSPDVGIAREAGAIIASPDTLAETALRVLRKESKGVLELRLLSKQEYGTAFAHTL